MRSHNWTKVKKVFSLGKNSAKEMPIYFIIKAHYL